MNQIILRLSLHDERALHALLARRHPRLDALFRVATHLGGAPGSILVALALLACGIPAATQAGTLAAFALVSSHALVHVIKRTANRPRPRLPVGLDSLVHAPDRFSFPSGHSAAALAVAAPMALAAGPVLAGAILALAAIVGFSRCYLGVHYPGDVVAGWLLALAATWAGILLGL